MSYSFDFNKLTNVNINCFSIHKGNYHLSKYKLSKMLVDFGGDEIVDKIMVYINNMERSLGLGRLYFYLKSGDNTSSTNIKHFKVYFVSDSKIRYFIGDKFDFNFSDDEKENREKIKKIDNTIIYRIENECSKIESSLVFMLINYGVFNIRKVYFSNDGIDKNKIMLDKDFGNLSSLINQAELDAKIKMIEDY